MNRCHVLRYGSAMLYAASLPLTAFQTEMRSSYDGFSDVTASSWHGWQVLMLGWAGILDGTVAWYSNPILLVSLNFRAKQKYSHLLMSCAPLLLASTSIFCREIWNDRDPPEQIVKYGLGFYLWLLSFTVFAWVAWVRRNELLSQRDRVATKTDEQGVEGDGW